VIELTGTEARLYLTVGAGVPAGQVSQSLYMTRGECLPNKYITQYPKQSSAFFPFV